MNAICCSENLDFRIVLPRPASLYITRKLALQAVQFSGFRSIYCLSNNILKPPFDNATIRQAMKYVIPKDLIRDVVLGGHAADGGSVIGPANTFWHNSAVKAPSQDIAKAKKILGDAGFTWKGGKLHYPG